VFTTEAIINKKLHNLIFDYRFHKFRHNDDKCYGAVATRIGGMTIF
jgi:hypothetical protein